MSITAESFTYVADLVRRRSGIVLDSGKEYLVEGRLLPLARAAALTDVDTYLRALRVAPYPSHLEVIVDALTTNETSWFRDVRPFKTLVEHMVPMIIKGCTGTPPVMRIWSAACSSGQEPYSIAMVMSDALPADRFHIVASDLSVGMVRRAQSARYSQLEINRGLPASMLVRHFARVGAEWEVVPALRALITVQRHNLLEAPPPGGLFDVVFLRNVLIYFDLPTKRDVLQRVQSVVRPGGFLVLGAAETTLGIDDSWERVATNRGSVYRNNARRAA